ncbi:MAG: hypothetical protein U0Q12_20740 [Vicinamibacterales bacterium]
MTERLAAALRQHRHLRSRRVVCTNEGTPLTRQAAWSRVRYAAQRARVPTGVHILRHTFCSHLSPSALDATIRLLEHRPTKAAVGDSLETPKN